MEFEKLHRHEYFEIIWLMDGAGVHRIDLQDHFYEGSVLFALAPGQLHKLMSSRPLRGFVLRFLPSLFKNEQDFFDYVLDTCLFDKVTSCPVIKVPSNVEKVLRDIFSHLLLEFQQEEYDSTSIISSYVKIIIAQVNRLKRGYAEAPKINDPQYKLFREFKLALEKLYKQDHAVSGFASRLGVTPRILNAIVKKFTGKTAGNVIQERILLEAKRSLFHESKSIKEICFELGFEDPAYFTRFFKKYTGVAPQHFRDHEMQAV